MTLAEVAKVLVGGVPAFSLPFDQQLHVQPAARKRTDMPLVADSHAEFPTESWPMFETRPTWLPRLADLSLSCELRPRTLGRRRFLAVKGCVLNGKEPAICKAMKAALDICTGSLDPDENVSRPAALGQATKMSS